MYDQVFFFLGAIFNGTFGGNGPTAKACSAGHFWLAGLPFFPAGAVFFSHQIPVATCFSAATVTI